MITLLEEAFNLNESYDYVYGNPYEIKFGNYSYSVGYICAGFCKQTSRITTDLGFNLRTPTTVGTKGQQLYFKSKSDAEKFLKLYESYLPNYNFTITQGKVESRVPAVNISKNNSIDIYCKIDNQDFNTYLNLPHYKYIKERISSKPKLNLIGDTNKVNRHELSMDVKQEAKEIMNKFINNINTYLASNVQSMGKYIFSTSSSISAKLGYKTLKKSLEGKTDKTRIINIEDHCYIRYNLKNTTHTYYHPSFRCNIKVNFNANTKELKLNSITLDGGNLIRYFDDLIWVDDTLHSIWEFFNPTSFEPYEKKIIEEFISINKLNDLPLFKNKGKDLDLKTFCTYLNQFSQYNDKFKSYYIEKNETELID